MVSKVLYRNAQSTDLTAIAEIFLAAFPDSIQHYVGHSIPPDVLIDAFAICLDAEPEALFVAEVENRLAGYIFSPRRFSNVIHTAIWHGHLAKLLWHWITGKYGVGIRPVYITIRNWLSLVRESREEYLHSDARILSIAVDPKYQGQGIGNGLLNHGLDYFKKNAVKIIRLEVRPENTAAIHLYEKFGFETRGKTHDTQGTWLIMLKELV